MNIYLICLVTKATPEALELQALYVRNLELDGHTVYYPARDTDQRGKALDINLQNLAAIEAADVVHVFYYQESRGIHFDLGMAFALRKPIRVLSYSPPESPKSYRTLITEWEAIARRGGHEQALASN